MFSKVSIPYLCFSLFFAVSAEATPDCMVMQDEQEKAGITIAALGSSAAAVPKTIPAASLLTVYAQRHPTGYCVEKNKKPK
jgi:hypothetical protein